MAHAIAPKPSSDAVVTGVVAPELYALLHRGTPGDRDFYLAACRGASAVLELGCGYGRLLAPLATAGHRVVGIDSDQGLLALARSRLAALPPEAAERVRLVRADMREFALPERFDRVLIPYNGLYCLGSEDAQVTCLANAARHLGPRGRIVFDGYAIDAFHAEADPSEDVDSGQEPVVSVAWRSDVWDVYETTHWERESQRLRVCYEYRARGGEPLRETIAHRYLLTSQIPAVCAAAGLRVRGLFGGFRRRPLGPESEHVVCLAETDAGP